MWEDAVCACVFISQDKNNADISYKTSPMHFDSNLNLHAILSFLCESERLLLAHIRMFFNATSGNLWFDFNLAVFNILPVLSSPATSLWLCFLKGKRSTSLKYQMNTTKHVYRHENVWQTFQSYCLYGIPVICSEYFHILYDSRETQVISLSLLVNKETG